MCIRDRDGPDTVSTHTAQEVGEYAAACGVSVLIVGVGSDVEVEDLQRICDLSVWGAFTQVNSFRDLYSVFEEIK